MPGPPPTPFKLKLLRGNPGKRAIRPEPEPTLLTEPPAPPRILRGDALDEWGRVTRELIRLGMLTVLDLRPLAAYCQVFGRWMAAEDTLALTAMPATDHLTYVVARNGEPHSPEALGKKFAEWATAAGLPPRCRLHGLRKARTAQLASLGASPHVIMAVTGHKSLSEVQRYADKFNRRKAADAAMALLKTGTEL